MSDDEICGTNFEEPSPLKKRNLPDPKERKELLKKRELLKSELNKIDKLFVSYVFDKMKDDSQLLKTGVNLNKQDEIQLFPRDRRFFVNYEDKGDCSSRFHQISMLYDGITANQFLFFVKQGLLEIKVLRAKPEEKEALLLYCLSILHTIGDEFTACLIVNFLSSCLIPFKVVSLKSWGSPHFGRLLLALEKSVANYNETETRELFRDVILASLDPITSSMTSAIYAFLDTCLQILSNHFKLEDEVEWIVQQSLQPEEFSHLLKVLPQAGCSGALRYILCKKALENILQAPETEPQIFTLEAFVEFLEQHKENVPKMPLNSVFHSLNIFNDIFLRFTSYNNLYLERLLIVLTEFMKHYRQENNTFYYMVNESLNRMFQAVLLRII